MGLRIPAALVAAAAALALVCVSIPAFAQSSDAIIRAGDEVEVRIPGARRTDERILRVDRSGEIDLSEYGNVHVEGMTAADARDVVADSLSRFIRETSRIEVNIHRRIRTVLVTGQVLEPGLLTLEGEPDVWIAIQQAGGTPPGADLSRVRLFRDGAERSLDLHSYLTGVSDEPLPELLSGDTIFVPAAVSTSAITGSAGDFLSEEALEDRVFVLGAVEGPGVFERTPNMDALTALALAGGAEPLADLPNSRLLTAEGSVRLDLQAMLLGQEEPLEIPPGAGVILFVPERPAAGTPNPWGQEVRLIGRTAFQGPVTVAGPIQLIDLLGDAGGFAGDADWDEVHIIRTTERSTLALHYELDRYLRSGGFQGSVWVHPGDVVFVDVLPENTAWESFVGVVRDLAIISSAALLWVQLSGGL